ncbi:hypothetical protein [Burkholderia gladioli]|uniref:hypothetical protein n=1 Tax=Burkholderia gladioli TaxID=28095 RepID=UPI002FE1B87C
MKKLVAVVVLGAVAIAAHAEPVYVLTSKCVGDTVRLAEQQEVLYAKRACKLPIVHQKQLRYFVQHIGGQDFTGCWGETLGDKVVLIGTDGAEETRLAGTYSKAEAAPDGTAKIVKSPWTGTLYEQAEHLCN